MNLTRFRIAFFSFFICSIIGACIWLGADDLHFIHRIALILFSYALTGVTLSWWLHTQKNPYEKKIWLKELRHGLKHNEFILYFQPIICAKNENIIGAEALLRWQHPQRGLLTPDAFLSKLENTDLIIPLGNWIIQQACQQIRQWHDRGFTNLYIAINLSGRHVAHPSLYRHIAENLQRYHLPPHALKLEITETFAMDNVEASRTILESLRKLGLQLALDDFGTGYSSLSYLRHFPFTSLKIDRSFIADIQHQASAAIVEAIVKLGKNLDLHLIAEGIETEEQRLLMKKLECDALQGYLLGKPVSRELFEKSYLSIA